MKPISFLLVAIAFIAVSTTSCNKISYRKTSSGLLYKIIPSSSKDSLAKYGDWLKIHFVQKRNDDSVLQSSYGKMPVYQQLMMDPNMKYNPAEIFPLLKKGDSAVVIMYIDSLINKPGMQMPPFLKKGDKLTLYFRVIDVFRKDSVKQADERVEYEKDAPRQQIERAEQMKQMQKQLEEERKSQLDEAEKSGEAQDQRQAMEAYLAGKHIVAQKAGKGVYVVVKDPGTGMQAAPGKFVNIKYRGRRLSNDSTFEDNTYAFQLGQFRMIEGWEEGLLLFKQGGKGTLYVPGFMAYGKNPPPQSPFKLDEPLIFDIEVVSVGDTMPGQGAPPPGQ